jgi:peptide/nickel transport system permease protein
VAWGIAIPLGILPRSASTRGSTSRRRLFAFIGLSIPELFFALLMMYFAAKTGSCFPVGGMRSLDYADLSFGGKSCSTSRTTLFLPALVLGTCRPAGRMRQMRANLSTSCRLDYVTTARAKGLDENKVVFKHAVRNAINPLITLFGFTIASLLSGIVHRRDRDGVAGLGSLTLEALLKQDSLPRSWARSSSRPPCSCSGT